MINKKLVPYIITVGILVFIALFGLRSCFVAPKPGNISTTKSIISVKSKLPIKMKQERDGSLLYRIILLGGIGLIIYLLVKPGGAKAQSPDLSLRIENQKIKTQNEGLCQQINLQKENVTRLIAFLQEKESTIKAMLANEEFLSKSFSDFRKQLNELQVGKSRLEKQLSEKEKELQNYKGRYGRRKIKTA